MKPQHLALAALAMAGIPLPGTADSFRGIPRQSSPALDSANAKLERHRAERLATLQAKLRTGTLTKREARELELSTLHETRRR